MPRKLTGPRQVPPAPSKRPGAAAAASAVADSHSLIQAVAKATASDLEEIDRQIAVLENELAQQKNRLAGEIAALRKLRAIVNLKVNGKQPRAKRGRPAGSTKTWGGGNGEFVAEIGSRQNRQNHPSRQPVIGGPPTEGDTKLITRIIQTLVVGGPMSDEIVASKLGEPVAAVRQSVGRCPGQVKRLSDNRLALPGHVEPKD